MNGLLIVLLGILGLAIGSFLNVVISRVPQRVSIVSPRSRCPGCETELRSSDNVPVVSYVALKGRCRTCAMPISGRYPAVELLTGAAFVALALRLHDQPVSLPAFLYFGALGLALACIDLDTRRLPDALTLSAYPVTVALLALAAATGGRWDDFWRAAAGGAALYAFYFLIVFIKPGGMGWGDVKLSGVLGLYLGWLGWGTLLVGAFAGFLLGGVSSIALLLSGRVGRKSRIPFGPFMILGAFVAVLVGGPLASAYVHLTTG